MAISEGEDLQNQLSIIKIGQNEANISFQVVVVPGTAQDNTGMQIDNVYTVLGTQMKAYNMQQTCFVSCRLYT